jgi:hypothetical protein
MLVTIYNATLPHNSEDHKPHLLCCKNPKSQMILHSTGIRSTHTHIADLKYRYEPVCVCVRVRACAHACMCVLSKSTSFMWDVWSTNWDSDRFLFVSFGFLCQYHSSKTTWGAACATHQGLMRLGVHTEARINNSLYIIHIKLYIYFSTSFLLSPLAIIA